MFFAVLISMADSSVFTEEPCYQVSPVRLSPSTSVGGPPLDDPPIPRAGGDIRQSYVRLSQLLEETAPLLLLEEGEVVVGGHHVEPPASSPRLALRTYSTPVVQFLLALSGFAPSFFVNIWQRFFPRRLWLAVRNVLGHDWKQIIRLWWNSDDCPSSLPEWGRWDDDRLTLWQRFLCFNRLVVTKIHDRCLTAQVQENILKWGYGERDVEGYAVLQQFQRWIQFREWDSLERDTQGLLADIARPQS